MIIRLCHFCARSVQSLKHSIAAGVQFLVPEKAMNEGMLLVPVKLSTRRIRSRRQM